LGFFAVFLDTGFLVAAFFAVFLDTGFLVAAFFAVFFGAGFLVAAFFAVFFGTGFLVAAFFAVFFGAGFLVAAFFAVFFAAGFLLAAFFATLRADFFLAICAFDVFFFTFFDCLVCFGGALPAVFAAVFVAAAALDVRFFFAVFRAACPLDALLRADVAAFFRVALRFAIARHPPLGRNRATQPTLISPTAPRVNSLRQWAAPRAGPGYAIPIMRIRERLAFLGQTSSDFERTGALQPSSRYLARAMTAPLRETPADARKARRILEIGPGTGAVTRSIAACMGPEDELECYEINGEFARYLERAVHEDPQMAPVADRIVVHHAPAQELAATRPFDFALCSVPLNNFDAATIEAILGPVFAALRRGGPLTLFEYLAFPRLRRTLSWGDAGQRLATAGATKERWLSAHGHGSTVVLRNLPPARVHRLVAS